MEVLSAALSRKRLPPAPGTTEHSTAGAERRAVRQALALCQRWQWERLAQCSNLCRRHGTQAGEGTAQAGEGTAGQGAAVAKARAAPCSRSPTLYPASALPTASRSSAEKDAAPVSIQCASLDLRAAGREGGGPERAGGQLARRLGGAAKLRWGCPVGHQAGMHAALLPGSPATRFFSTSLTEMQPWYSCKQGGQRGSGEATAQRRQRRPWQLHHHPTSCQPCAPRLAQAQADRRC